MSALNTTDRAAAVERLRGMLPAGSRATTICTHVSRSGMQRRIRVIICQDGQPSDISWLVSRAIGWSMDDRGIRVDGTGMDMGFHLVYTLSLLVHGGDGYAIKQVWL